MITAGISIHDRTHHHSGLGKDTSICKSIETRSNDHLATSPITYGAGFLNDIGRIEKSQRET